MIVKRRTSLEKAVSWSFNTVVVASQTKMASQALCGVFLALLAVSSALPIKVNNLSALGLFPAKDQDFKHLFS